MMFARYLQKIQLLKDSEVSVIKYVLLFLLVSVHWCCCFAQGALWEREKEYRAIINLFEAQRWFALSGL